MVHSTDQRTIAESNGSKPPTLKTVTVKTVETYNRNQNTVRKLTTRSVDGVLESKQTVVTDIGKTTPLFGSQINLRRDKIRSTPCSGSRTPQKHTEISKVPSRLFPKTKDINKEEFAKDCLEAHNEYRAKHKSPPLKLSSQLCTFSQEWAEHLASILKMQHHPSNKYGENFYMFMTTDPNHRVKGRDAVDNWYQGEIEKYRFGEEPSDLEAGHLTQVLWEGSEFLGVGVARNGYYTFVVCNYNPPGNYKGEYAENVPPVHGWRDEKTGELVVRSPKKRTESHETFVKEVLRLHNECRSKHGVGPLVLGKSLNDHAQSWANNLAEKGLFLHRPNNYFGENLFWSSEVVYAKDVVETWYAEHALYKYNVEPFKSGATFNCGHFSQMVWKDTKQLGIGLAKGKNGTLYVVANYSPRGNIINKFISNVLPPKNKK